MPSRATASHALELPAPTAYLGDVLVGTGDAAREPRESGNLVDYEHGASVERYDVHRDGVYRSSELEQARASRIVAERELPQQHRSARVRWRVEDLIGGDKQLDFGRHFLPEEFTRTRRLPFLDADERRTLSQLRGYVYLKMFVNIEAFVMPFVVEQAMLEPEADDVRTRALLEFAAEEAKHTQMLNRFAEDSEARFPAPVQVIGPPEDIAAEISERDTLGVALTVLGGEWVSLEHYVGSVKDSADLDPLFKDMLEHHWLEESQHARMDKVLVEQHAATLTPDEIARGIDAYFEIGDFFDAGLQQQVQFDLESFQLATGRRLDPDERETFLTEQLQALRWTFLGSAMVQRRFLDVLERLQPGAAERALEVAARMR